MAGHNSGSGAVLWGSFGILSGAALVLVTGQVADLGWAAVTSDYVGLGTPGPHPYLVGPPAAYNVLDAALAAQQLPGLDLSDDTVLWGHSQGGHGALWSAGLTGEYAPSLNVLGVAALAPATDLFELAINVKDSAPGKIVSAYIAGAWQEVYPELGVEDYLRRDYQHTIDQVAQNCFSGLDSLASIARTSQMFGAVFAVDAFDPAGSVATKLSENSVSPQTSGPIDVPVLIAQGEADSLVLASMQDDWVTKTCAAGQDLEYRTYAGLDHMPLVDSDSPVTPQLVQWTQDRLAGEPSASTC